MEEKRALLLKEKDKLVSTLESSSEDGDDLDAYMSGLSSQLGEFPRFLYLSCIIPKFTKKFVLLFSLLNIHV